MPSRPDLRDIATNVRDAFADADRDTLLDVLTFVVKEYVVEGPPPMLVHQAETLADLKGATFAQVITALQTRFDHPELAMFVVDGEQVSVRVGGVVQPLTGQRTPLVAAAELPRPSAGVRVVETTLAQRPPPAAPAGAAPPPVRGVSLRGAPTPGSAPAPAAPAPAPPPAPASAAPVPSDKPEKPEGSGDDASARFSLLELD
ncbi:MAG: hypothetical protein ABI867_13730 [Kofleriaceae bacterium]